MMAFEVLNDRSDVLYRCIAVCDHCYAKIKGSGIALIVAANIPSGLSIGGLFQYEPTVFHVHWQCHNEFVAAYNERHGSTSFLEVTLLAYLAGTITGVFASDDKQEQRIFNSVKRVVESGYKP